MAFFGVFVLGTAGYHMLHPEIPHFETIGLIGLLALSANAVCLLLLWQHRAQDINMRSVWLCSRNDIVANVSVLVAALGVWATHFYDAAPAHQKVPALVMRAWDLASSSRKPCWNGLAQR